MEKHSSHDPDREFIKQMRNRSKRYRKGFTLVEVVVGSAISFIVLTSAITLFIACVAAWGRGETMMDGENDTRQAIRVVSDELRQAMWVSIDADGMGITYRIPQKDAITGDYSVPVVWDGVDRRIFLSGSNLRLKGTGGVERTIARNVLTVDPFMLSAHQYARKRKYGTAAEAAPTYKIFTTNTTGIVSEVTIKIVTGKKGGQVDEWQRTRKRERVVLRNVPELIK